MTSGAPNLDRDRASALTVIPDERHDRSRFIGGSDIAGVLGISPWKTPFQTWQRKVQARHTPTDEQRNRAAKARGHRWESVVAEMLVEHLIAEGHAVEIIGSNVRYQDPELPFLAAEIDFEILLDGESEITNVELKTVHPFAARHWGEAGTDGCPVHYTAQAMHGLGVTGRRRCLVAALFGADEIKAYPVDRDDETIAALRARADHFWNNHVLTEIPPDPQTLADLAALYPGADGDVTLIADDHLRGLWLRLRALKNEITARESEFEVLAFELQSVMQDATKLVAPGEGGKTLASWKPRKSSFVDLEALRVDHPKLARQYTRTRTTRPLTINQGT